MSKKENAAVRHLNGKTIDVREGGVFLADCRDLLEAMPEHSIDLTLSSPPYCIGQEYDKSTKVVHFEEALAEVLPKLVAKTRDGGHICLQLGYHYSKQGLVPLDALVFRMMSEIPEMKLRNRIIWTFGSGPHARVRFSGRHETILWYSKGEATDFDLDAVRVPQKYPGKRHYKGDKKGQYSSNPLGKNPGDVWEIPNVKSSHPEKTIHPCQFPIALAERLIRALTQKMDLVFDPFCGAGTTGASATMLGRRFVGAEIKRNYAKVAARRIQLASLGLLPFRPIDKPILDPSTQGNLTVRSDG